MKRAIVIVLCVVACYVTVVIAVPFSKARAKRTEISDALKGRLSPGMLRHEVEAACRDVGYEIGYFGIGADRELDLGFSYQVTQYGIWLPFGGSFRTRLIVVFDGDTLARYAVEIYHEAL